MQQIMNLLQKQLDASRRIATQQAAMLATADLELLGADPETIKVCYATCATLPLGSELSVVSSWLAECTANTLRQNP